MKVKFFHKAMDFIINSAIAKAIKGCGKKVGGFIVKTLPEVAKKAFANLMKNPGKTIAGILKALAGFLLAYLAGDKIFNVWNRKKNPDTTAGEHVKEAAKDRDSDLYNNVKKNINPDAAEDDEMEEKPLFKAIMREMERENKQKKEQEQPKRQNVYGRKPSQNSTRVGGSVMTEEFAEAIESGESAYWDFKTRLDNHREETGEAMRKYDKKRKKKEKKEKRERKKAREEKEKLYKQLRKETKRHYVH